MDGHSHDNSLSLDFVQESSGAKSFALTQGQSDARGKDDIYAAFKREQQLAAMEAREAMERAARADKRMDMLNKMMDKH